MQVVINSDSMFSLTVRLQIYYAIKGIPIEFYYNYFDKMVECTKMH